jgi:hypothetical protein
MSTASARTLLFDLRLPNAPNDADVARTVVEPLQLALKVQLSPVSGTQLASATRVLTSADGAVVVVVRASGDGPGLVTVNVDLPV